MKATPVRRVLGAATLVPALLAGACGGDGGVGPSEVDGTYVLQEVNGSGLPATLTVDYQDAVIEIIVQSGQVALNRGGYSAQMVIESPLGVTTITDSGTFAVTGQTVTFDSSDPQIPNFTAALSGNTLTQDVSYPDLGDIRAIYRK